jgi:hypothetical protein
MPTLGLPESSSISTSGHASSSSSSTSARPQRSPGRTSSSGSNDQFSIWQQFVVDLEEPVVVLAPVQRAQEAPVAVNVRNEAGSIGTAVVLRSARLGDGQRNA